MSRQTSRLTTVLRVRRLQEEISRGRLAAESAAERRAHLALEQAHERYSAPVAESMALPETTRAFVAQLSHRGVLAGAVRTGVARVDMAASVTVVARADWSAAALRKAGLERLDDRARMTALTERLSAEQRTSEESGSVKRQRVTTTKNVQGKGR
jgi:hypothetical protein